MGNAGLLVDRLGSAPLPDDEPFDLDEELALAEERDRLLSDVRVLFRHHLGKPFLQAGTESVHIPTNDLRHARVLPRFRVNSTKSSLK